MEAIDIILKNIQHLEDNLQINKQNYDNELKELSDCAGDLATLRYLNVNNGKINRAIYKIDSIRTWIKDEIAHNVAE